MIAEAQASGLPVVAVNEGGPASLIEDRHTGWLCAPDAGQLAAAVAQLAASSFLRERISRAAIESVRGRTWEVAMAQLAQGYDRALGGGDPARRRPRERAPRTGAPAPLVAGGLNARVRVHRRLTAQTRWRVAWSWIAPLEPTETEALEPSLETARGTRDEPQDTPPDLEDPSLYFNRELSWLDFNDRVLQLAEDPSVPLLERVKFCAIWESNLDEFYMVRVANLQDQVEAGRGRAGRRRDERVRAAREIRAGGRRPARRGSSAAGESFCPRSAEHGIRLDLARGRRSRAARRALERSSATRSSRR